MTSRKKKLIRLTTSDVSLDILLRGQLGFMSRYLDVTGVAADTGRLKEVGVREGIRVVHVPIHREISLLADFKALWLLYRLFRKEKPDIVHANTPKGSLLAMMAAKAAGVKQRFYTVTGLRFETARGNFRRLMIAMERLTCACATKVIPEGEGVKRKLIAHGITDKELAVVHFGNISGIDLDYFKRTPEIEEQAAAIRRDAGGQFRFIFIGRLVGDKGINELVTAFRSLHERYPEARLILVGSPEPKLDPLPESTLSLIKTHPAIIAPGFKRDVRPWLAAADSLVLSSYREGFPNVVLQAGAMELPSVVTDVNGANEVITNGYNGFVVPVADTDALLEAMEAMITDQRQATLMGSLSRAVVSERFDRRDVWSALLDLYLSD